MGNLATPIAESLKFTDFIMNLVTGDLTDALATRRARDDEGASIAWVIGHLSHYRYEIMKLLGHEMESPFAEQFGTTGATDGAAYPSVEELRSTWADLSTRVRSVAANARSATGRAGWAAGARRARTATTQSQMTPMVTAPSAVVTKHIRACCTA